MWLRRLESSGGGPPPYRDHPARIATVVRMMVLRVAFGIVIVIALVMFVFWLTGGFVTFAPRPH
jgi:hypothetical protein